jgi:hypothetical protein
MDAAAEADAAAGKVASRPVMSSDATLGDADAYRRWPGRNR